MLVFFALAKDHVLHHATLVERTLVTNHGRAEEDVQPTTTTATATTVTTRETTTTERRSLLQLQQQQQNPTSTNTTAATAGQTPPTTASTKRRRISMIVPLSGELGNNLMRLTHAYAMKSTIEGKLPHVTIDLLGEHQNDPKWTRPAADIQKCFPNLRDFQFSSGRWDETGEYTQRMDTLQAWLNTTTISSSSHQENPVSLSTLDMDNGLEEGISLLSSLLHQQEQEPNNLQIQEPTNANISLPYVRVHLFVGDIGLVQKHRAKIQQWLSFDKTSPECCGVIPDADETVFHFRNYAAESKGLINRGYVEVGPKHVTQLLQNHLPPNNSTKLTLITRHYKNNPNAAQNHIGAITNCGNFYLRVTPEQTGVQDFCLLLYAKHIVATRDSSFARTAGMLGNQTTVVSYTVNATESWKNKRYLFVPREWNANVDPTLKNRFQDFIYPNEYRH